MYLLRSIYLYITHGGVEVESDMKQVPVKEDKDALLQTNKLEKKMKYKNAHRTQHSCGIN